MLNNRTDIHIEQLLCARTNTYQDLHYRPMGTDVTTEAVNRFRDDTFNGEAISSATLGGVAGMILRPSTEASDRVNIANGWKTERLSFILVVHEGSPFNKGTIVRVMHGYTDRYEPTLDGLIPEDTRLYFNSEVVYREISNMSASGAYSDLMCLGTNQILRGYSQEEREEFHPRSDLISIRPEDVFSYHLTDRIQRQSMEANNIRGRVVRNFDHTGRSIHTIDNASRFGRGNELKFSRRSDLSSPSYLTNTLLGFRSTANDVHAHSFDAKDVFGSALRHTENQSISDNRFLATLRNKTRLSDHGYVTLGELIGIFPETDEVTVLPNPRDFARGTKYDGDSTEHWCRRDNIGIASSMVKQIVPAVAAECLFQVIGFTVESLPNREFNIIPYPDSMMMISELADPRRQFAKFCDRLTEMLLLPMTMNGELALFLSCNMDLAGDTEYDISLDGSEDVPFLYPTYMDSMDSLLLDNDDRNLEHVAKDIYHLIEQGTDWGDNVGIDSGHFDFEEEDEDEGYLPYDH